MSLTKLNNYQDGLAYQIADWAWFKTIKQVNPQTHEKLMEMTGRKVNRQAGEYIFIMKEQMMEDIDNAD